MFGLALLVFAWLMGRSPAVPARIAQPTFVSGLLLVLIYMGSHAGDDPAHRLTLAPPVLCGLLVNPAWYLVPARWLRPAVSDGQSPPPPA